MRSVPVATLAGAAASFGIESVTAADVAQAVKIAVETAESTDLVCVTGSHYVVGEARSYLGAPSR